MTTPKNVLPEWAAAQATPWASINQSLFDIDQLMNVSVLDVTLTSPPGSENEGDAYIVASGAFGGWSGQDNKLAYYINGAYVFKSLPIGTIVYNVGDTKHYAWNGTVYSEFSGGGGGGSIAIDQDGTEILASASRFNFTGGSVAITDAGFGVADIVITGGGGGADTGAWEFKENISTTGGSQILIDVSGADEVILVGKTVDTSGGGFAHLRLSPDGGTTIRNGASEYNLMFVYSTDDQIQNIDSIPLVRTTGAQEFLVKLAAVSVPQSTVFNSHIGDSTGTIIKNGWNETEEVHDTIVLDASAGTFSAMDIDVYIRNGIGDKIEAIIGTVHNGTEGIGTGETQIGEVYQYTDANYRRVIIHMNQLGTDGPVEITLPAGTFSKIVGAVQNSQTAEITNGVAIIYDNGVDPNKFTLDRTDAITGPLVLTVCLEGIV